MDMIEIKEKILDTIIGILRKAISLKNKIQFFTYNSQIQIVLYIWIAAMRLFFVILLT